MDSPDEFLQELATFGPDVILADYQVGSEENGLDFLKSYDGQGAVLALITANTSDHVLARAAEIGAAERERAAEPCDRRGACEDDGVAVAIEELLDLPA